MVIQTAYAAKSHFWLFYQIICLPTVQYLIKLLIFKGVIFPPLMTKQARKDMKNYVILLTWY